MKIKKLKRLIKYFDLLDNPIPTFKFSHEEVIEVDNEIEVNIHVKNQIDSKGYLFKNSDSEEYPFMSEQGAAKVSRYYGAKNNYSINKV